MTNKTLNTSNWRSWPLGLVAKTSSIIAALLLCLGLGTALAQPAISVNYCSAANSDPGYGPTSAGGVVSVQNWNNVVWRGNTGDLSNPTNNFYDSAGLFVPGFNVTLPAGDGYNSWNTGPNGTLSGGLFSEWVWQANPITIANIPYQTYDLYLYLGTWNGGTGTYTIGGNTLNLDQTIDLVKPQAFATLGFQLGYNYVVFSGLTGSSQTIANNYGISAFQIVATTVGTTHTITVTQTTGGNISPGTGYVADGGSATYTITPSLGYAVSHVVIDGTDDRGAVTTVTLSGVTTAHSITATFVAQDPQLASGKVIDSVTSAGIPNATVYVKQSAPANISPFATVTADGSGNWSTSLAPGTWHVVASADGYDMSADATFTVPVGSPVTVADIALVADPNWNVLFIAKSSDCTGTTWPLTYPATTMSTIWSPSTVTTIDGQQWEVNTAAVGPYPWVVNGGGWLEASGVSLPLIVNGMSAVVVVDPITGVPNGHNRDWDPVVDVLFGCFRLGVRNDNGHVVVQRQIGSGNGALSGLDNSTAAISGKTVLSLVVAPDNSYKVWANGIQIMSGASVSGFSYTALHNQSYFNSVCVGISVEDTAAAFNGNIGDVYVYKSALGDADRYTLESSLGTKFGVSVVAPPISRTITGNVKDGGGTGVPGAAVTLKSSGGTTLATGTSGTGGAYTLTASLAAGDYTVRASAVGYTPGSTPLTVDASTPTYSGIDITITATAGLTPLVDVRASDLTPGSAVSSWVNQGSLGGNFIPAPANPDGWGLPAPTAAVGGGKKAVWFDNNPMVLVDGSGNAIQLSTSVLGTYDSGTGNSLTSPVFTMAAWVYKQQLLTDQQSAYCTMAPFPYGANFFYGAGWGLDAWMGNTSIGFNAYPAAGSWHQIVATCDGTTVSLYVDGALNNSFAPSPSAGCIADRDPGWWGPAGGACGTYLGANDAVLLGATAFASPGFYGPDRHYTGYLGGLRIYDTALSADDVTALYAGYTLTAGTTYTVTGNVYGPDGITGLVGATVSVSSGGVLVTAPVTTGTGGAYTVSVGPGTYDVSAVANGYMGATHTGVAVAGDVTGENFTLQAIPADRLAISIDAGEATSDGVVNHGYYGGNFVPAQGTPAVGLAGPSEDQKPAINFAGNRLELRASGSAIPAGLEVCGNQPFTVVAWVYQDPTIMNGDHGQRNMYFTWSPLGSSGAAGCGLGWELWGGAFPGFDSDNTPVVNWSGYSTDWGFGTVNTSLMPWNVWLQIVTLYDGTKLHFYKNSVEVTTSDTASSTMPFTYNLQTTAGNPFDLGGFSNGWGDAWYWGSIARLKMYSKALTQSEINSDFASPPGVAKPDISVSITQNADGTFTITATSNQVGSVNVGLYRNNVDVSLSLSNPAWVLGEVKAVSSGSPAVFTVSGGGTSSFFTVKQQ